MARLPIPGADNGTWGDILNDYLSQVHSPDGTLKNGVVGANALAPGAVSEAALAAGAGSDGQVLTYDPLAASRMSWKPLLTGGGGVAGVSSVNTRTGAVTLAKSDVGLGNVDNTSDADKPISNAVLAALNNKLDSTQKGAANGVATLDASGKIPASQLPAAAGQVNPDWNATSGAAQILNKPTLGSAAATSVSTDSMLGGAGASDTTVASQKAVKTYVDTAVAGVGGSTPTDDLSIVYAVAL